MQRAEGSEIHYKCDFDKHVLLANFERRGWTRHTDDEGGWDFYWASVFSVRQIFSPEPGRRLADHQVVNHFPNHYELTRKDLMARNIKRYRKDREKQDALGAESYGHEVLDKLPPEWVPTTFALPNDYALFVEEFRRNPTATWIAKPTGKAQGRGIFLVSKLQQLKKWSNPTQKAPSSLPFREPYIISRYINDPLLVGGKKFDMRLYVLVTNYRPLKAYLYRAGFCRFCVEQYSDDVAEIDNIFVHLTNVAIQKQAEDYNEQHGGKWALEDLLLFIESSRGLPAREKLAADMEAIIIHSLKAVQGVMQNDRHCFEMYGFDILLDRQLKPWLLEVNASPSLSTTTEEDRLLKLRLINDVVNIVMLGSEGDEDAAARVGDFVCIIDEAKAVRDPQSLRDDRRRFTRSTSLGRGGMSGWR